MHIQLVSGRTGKTPSMDFPIQLHSAPCCSRFPLNRHARNLSEKQPLLHCAVNGLGILCLGMCYRRFTTLLRAPNGVSKEDSCSDRFF